MQYNHKLKFNYIEFPDPNLSDQEGLVAYGGNLSPDMILSAYVQGIYPWFNHDSEILWWSPNPRMVLYPEKFKYRKSLRNSIKKQKFEFSRNKCFNEVIKKCASVKRKGQDGTWITANMIKAYSKLHQMGVAHSFETFQNGELVGGLYGLRIGAMFFGESMFSLVNDSSKAALHELVNYCIDQGIVVIDVQQSTNHLRSLGAEDIQREKFLEVVSCHALKME